MNNRLKWKRAALLLAAGAAAAGGCAWAVQGELTTAWYEVSLPAGLEGLDGVKIAQISDVHSADLEGPLRAALEEAAPDLIVMTGDLVNREDRDLSRALSLARMAAETAPAFFAPGNHEVDSPCWPELRDGLEAAGVQVLEDRAVLRNFRGGGGQPGGAVGFEPRSSGTGTRSGDPAGADPGPVPGGGAERTAVPPARAAGRIRGGGR